MPFSVLLHREGLFSLYQRIRLDRSCLWNRRYAFCSRGMELKCQFTGQDTTNAINQYKFDRAGKDAIFAFKERVLVHFAVDLTNVYMTTRLEGAHTYFLPFNQGSNGAGKVGGNGDKFLEDIFCGPVGDAKNPFEQVTVADAVLETESDNRNLLEQKIKDLCRVKRQAVISEDNENAGKYKIEVEFSGIESDSEVTVSPFNSKQEQTLSEHIEFSELEILQLSEFYEITARSGDDTIRRIIMIPTSGFPDDRESAAVNSVVKDRASFVEYIAFVLGDDYVASMLEGKQMGESGFFANSSDAMPALYEKMLKTSVEGPERIKDIGYVLKMVTDKDIIPDEFRELYETFCNTLKIRR